MYNSFKQTSGGIDIFLLDRMKEQEIITELNVYVIEGRIHFVLSETNDHKLILFAINIDPMEKVYEINIFESGWEKKVIGSNGFHYYPIEKKSGGKIQVKTIRYERTFIIDDKEIYDKAVFLFFDEDKPKCIKWNPDDTGAFKQQETTKDVFRVPIYNYHFVQGPFLEVLGGDENITYKAKFIDRAAGSEIYSTTYKSNHWARAGRKYYTEWQLILEVGGKIVFLHDFNPKGKRIFISMDSKSLGDTIAWIPYVEEFRKKHDSIVIISTFWNKLFQKEYPELIFVEPEDIVNDIYAQFLVGCYSDPLKNPNDPREIPLQQVSSDILGLPFTEIKPRISLPEKFYDLSKLKKCPSGKYICISEHSTAQCKYWNYPGGWQVVVDFLREKGVNPVVISKEPTNLKGIFNRTNGDINRSIALLKESAGFIGVSSGPAWLAWALDVPTVMVSGCTKPDFEFVGNEKNIRVHDGAVCNGCLNDIDVVFDKGKWNWCPENKDFECTKAITPDTVIEAVSKLL